MDTVQNLRAFLAVARSGSFSAAGRQSRLATSVMTKRVDQLEASIGTRLFMRTTRAVVLTEAGQRWIGRVQSLVADIDNAMADARLDGDLEGPIRIKAPTTLTVLYLAGMLSEFQRRHPRVTIDMVLTDRALNPIDEGFDMAVAAFGTSFAGVTDISLCPLRRMLCAAPEYLARRGMPSHPRDLVQHDTLSFQPTGHVWSFNNEQGPVQVEVRPAMTANDGQVLLAGALAGNGIALLSEYIFLPSLRSGALVPVLEDFPPPEIWLKMLVPQTRIAVPRIGALLEFVRGNFYPSPPWVPH